MPPSGLLRIAGDQMTITLQDFAGRLVLCAVVRGASARRVPPRSAAINFVLATTPAAAPDGLFNGAVDIAWGGPMRVLQIYDRDRLSDCDLVCFAEPLDRDSLSAAFAASSHPLGWTTRVPTTA